MKQSPRKKTKHVMEATQETKEELIRMNINISKVFYKKIKQKALDEDTTVTDVVVRALNEYLGD